MAGYEAAGGLGAGPHPPRDDAKTSTGPLGAALEYAFRLGGRLRGARVFHPAGSLWSGALDVVDPLSDAGAFSHGGPHPAQVRFSFGAGFPRPVPDFRGLAIRMVDAYGPQRPQDLLLVSSLAPPLFRHLLLPVPRGSRVTHSTVLPYALGDGRLVMFGARPVGEPRDRFGASDLDLVVAPVLGRWQVWARWRIGAPVPDEEAAGIHFDPWNTAPALRPVTFVNALRGPAYRGSRDGRRADRTASAGVAGNDDPRQD